MENAPWFFYVVMVALPIISFLWVRSHFKNLLIYIIGEKAFKEEFKKQSFKERFWYTNYKKALPKWMQIWYIVEIISAIAFLPSLFLADLYRPFMLVTLFFMLVIMSGPSYYRIRLINKWGGVFCDYRIIVDKYAARRKLYPELYEDEDEEYTEENRHD